MIDHTGDEIRGQVSIRYVLLNRHESAGSIEPIYEGVALDPFYGRHVQLPSILIKLFRGKSYGPRH